MKRITTIALAALAAGVIAAPAVEAASVWTAKQAAVIAGLKSTNRNQNARLSALEQRAGVPPMFVANGDADPASASECGSSIAQYAVPETCVYDLGTDLADCGVSLTPRDGLTAGGMGATVQGNTVRVTSSQPFSLLVVCP